MSNIKLFESKQIRSVWNESDSKWYFSVADVVETLTDTANVRDYIKKMRKREPELNTNWGTICPPLELLASDGKHKNRQDEQDSQDKNQENCSSAFHPVHPVNPVEEIHWI